MTNPILGRRPGLAGGRKGLSGQQQGAGKAKQSKGNGCSAIRTPAEQEQLTPRRFAPLDCSSVTPDNLTLVLHSLLFSLAALEGIK